MLGIYWRRIVQPPPVPARLLALAWAVCLIVIWARTAWAFCPTWPVGAPWYGQWAADLGHMKPFLGTPLSITAGGDPLLPGRAFDQSRLEDAIAAQKSFWKYVGILTVVIIILYILALVGALVFAGAALFKR